MRLQTEALNRAATQRGHDSARRFFFLLPSVIVLLALALFPTGARAESSSESVYHLTPGSIESVGPETNGNSETPTKNRPGSKADHKAQRTTKATNGGESTDRTATDPEGEREPEEGHESGVTPPGDGGNKPPGDSGGPGEGASPKTPGDSGRRIARSSSRQGAGSVAPRQAVPTATEIETSQGNGGGGPSPLVPVLIAVGVLAAISFGTALYRRRKHDPRTDPPTFLIP